LALDLLLAGANLATMANDTDYGIVENGAIGMADAAIPPPIISPWSAGQSAQANRRCLPVRKTIPGTLRERLKSHVGREAPYIASHEIRFFFQELAPENRAKSGVPRETFVHVLSGLCFWEKPYIS